MNLVRATRQAIERRMSISDFDAVLDMMTVGGGVPSYTGKFVTPQTALAVDAYWACVNVLADDFATLPLYAYRWDVPGVSREEARDHYLWPLFTEEANPRMPSHRFKRQMETWRNVWGNCYAEIEMNGRGQVTALWPWRPDRVRVWQADPNDVRSEIYYSYIPLENSEKPLTVNQDRMLHVRGTSLDGFRGMSIIETHRHTLALSMGMTEFAGRFYSNGASVKGVLSHPGKLGIKGRESLEASFDRYRGLENAHRMLILEENMQYKETAMPLKDAQFLESIGANAEAVARLMKVPQHRIGLLDRATNNNIEQQAMEYVQYTLGPNAANWCGEVHSSLLSARERASIFLQPDFKYLLMADHAGRAAYYTALGNQGAFSPDDFRHMEGKNPLPGGIGKAPRVPMNTVALGSDEANSPRSAKSQPPTQPQSEPKPNGVAFH